ncbi:hypothetical protein BDS110ZK14_82910 [Bradyrhizobium diazoefficiens]
MNSQAMQALRRGVWRQVAHIGLDTDKGHVTREWPVRALNVYARWRVQTRPV